MSKVTVSLFFSIIITNIFSSNLETVLHNNNRVIIKYVWLNYSGLIKPSPGLLQRNVKHNVKPYIYLK